MSEVERYYDENPQYEWERLERHRTEFAVTMRVLKEHLPQPPARVLDVGGGPGRYAIALAAKGYQVTLVDLSSKELDFAREKAEEAGVELAGYVHANATDLSPFSREISDAVLLMGPLYHLLRTVDRWHAVQEAARVLRPGGLVFAAFITRYAPIRYVGKHDPAFIVNHRERLEELLVTGAAEKRPDGGFTDAYFAHPSEIEPFMAQGGFEAVDLIACEGVVSMIDERINTLEGNVWEAWVELNYLLGADPTVHGAAEHLLYVGKKE